MVCFAPSDTRCDTQQGTASKRGARFCPHRESKTVRKTRLIERTPQTVREPKKPRIRILPADSDEVTVVRVRPVTPE